MHRAVARLRKILPLLPLASVLLAAGAEDELEADLPRPIGGFPRVGGRMQNHQRHTM